MRIDPMAVELFGCTLAVVVYNPGDHAGISACVRIWVDGWTFD